MFSSIGGLVRPMCNLFLFNFVILIVARINGTSSPPTLQTSRATSQTSLLVPRTPTVGWLLCLHFKFQPLTSLTPKSVLVGMKNSRLEGFWLAKRKHTNIPTMMEPFPPPAPWFCWMANNGQKSLKSPITKEACRKVGGHDRP